MESRLRPWLALAVSALVHVGLALFLVGQASRVASNGGSSAAPAPAMMVHLVSATRPAALEKAPLAAAVAPAKWQLSPWGDLGGGFWVIAVMEDRVLWYNDIEDGFNVSRFVTLGTIPSTEYWCNQDELRWALPALAGQPQGKLGPPEPLS